MEEPRSSDVTSPGTSEETVKVGVAATRPGPLGRPVAVVLAGALVLAAVAWVAAEYWGEAHDGEIENTIGQPAVTDPTSPSSAPSQSDPASSAPTDRDPTPPSSTGGDSQTTETDGTN